MKAIGSSAVVKIIHVVTDLERTLDGMCDIFGIDRPETIRGGAEDREKTGGKYYTVFRGEDVAAPVLLANVSMGPIVIEVIQPLDENTPWGRFLKEKGEGVFSVVYTVPNFDAAADELALRGMGVFHRGEYPGGRYGYADTARRIGFTLGLQSFDK